MILRSLNSESITNPAQFRIWTFRRHNPPPTLFPYCLAHPAVWCSSHHPIPLQGFFFSVDQMPDPVFLSELCSTRLDWHAFRHTKTDFDCYLSLPVGWRLPAWLALPRGQDLDPDVLLSNHTEISSWTMTDCSSRLRPNPSPVLATWSYSIETLLYRFLVCGSQLFSPRSSQWRSCYSIPLGRLCLPCGYGGTRPQELCFPTAVTQIPVYLTSSQGRAGCRSGSERLLMGKAWVLSSLLVQQNSSWTCLFPSAWVLISSSSSFQYLPPSNQVQLLLYISLNLLFSQPLLLIKLDIRTAHQLELFRSRVGCLCVNAVAWVDLDFSAELQPSLVLSPVQVFRSHCLPQKTLNSPGRSQ